MIGPKKPLAGVIQAFFWNSIRAFLVSVRKRPVGPTDASFVAAGPASSAIRNDCNSFTGAPVMPMYRLRVNGLAMDAVVENDAVVQLELPVEGAEFASARSVASWLRRLCNSRANEDVDA